MARILVVDDSELFRSDMIDILADLGHEVAGEAVDGADAVEKFALLRPDITTMDITMPEKDGIEALEEILALDPDAKVLMVSATAQKPTISKALIIGAYGFVPKPLDRAEIERAIAEIAYCD